MSARRSHFSRYTAIPYRRLDGAWGGLLRQSPVNCGAMRPPAAGVGVSGNSCPMACGSIARRPKPTKLALNATLRTYVEERLAGGVVPPTGAPVPGPSVPWKGAGMARARIGDGPKPGALSRLPDACDRLPGRQDDAHQPRSFLSGTLRSARGALRRELTACLRTGVYYGCPGRAYAGEARALSRRRLRQSDAT